MARTYITQREHFRILQFFNVVRFKPFTIKGRRSKQSQT
jgi:hypothetical protein